MRWNAIVNLGISGDRFWGLSGLLSESLFGGRVFHEIGRKSETRWTSVENFCERVCGFVTGVFYME